MNTSDQQRFDAIRHRLERVTSGPWTVAGRRPNWPRTVIVAMPDTGEAVAIADTELRRRRPTDQDAANAEFFAHSLDDITWLTERVRDLERGDEGADQ